MSTHHEHLPHPQAASLSPTSLDGADPAGRSGRSVDAKPAASTLSSGVSRLGPARVAGLLYLAIIVCGLFAEVVVRSRLIEPGDATATAANIADADWLFRMGLGADMVMLLADVAIAVVLYRLFAPISKTLSMLAAAFRLTQTAVIGLNLLNMFAALLIIRDTDYLDGFEPGQSDSLALQLLDMHKYGYTLGLTFFGVSTLIVGYMALSSNSVPKPLGVVLGLAGAGYLADGFMFFLVPGYDGSISLVVLAPALVGELWFCGWLLFKGRRIQAHADSTTTGTATAKALA